MGERMRADGAGGDPSRDDGVAVTPGAGESGGGARPGKEGHGDGGSRDSFLGHGGQSANAYHGPQQLGSESTEAEQQNAGTR